MKKILGPLCTLIVLGLLAAGLWPFNPFPRNDVAWLADRNGLRFGKSGTIFTLGTFDAPGSNKETSCGLEIWLRPASGFVKSSVTLLTFYRSDNPLQFRLMQYRDGLFVRRDYRNSRGVLETAEIEIPSGFHDSEPVLFTLSVRPRVTMAYKNGVLVDFFRSFGLSCQDLSGQLIMGSSPVIYNPWQGDLFGLAIYNGDLTREQVARHQVLWAEGQIAELRADAPVLALYSFGDRSGKAVQGDGAVDHTLQIPETFRILHKKILTAPWEEFSPDLGYVLDVVINVAGFVPFGLLFCAYLTVNRQWNRAGVATIVAGALISITIEALQVWIPERSSGMTDIITNTMGTSLGVVFWGWRPVKNLLAKIGVNRGPARA